MSKDDNVKLAPVHELPDILREDFEELRRIDIAIADLMEMHIKPVAKERTKLIRILKGKTGISRQVLMHGYKGYTLDKKADDFESENEAQALRYEMKTMFDALRVGQMLNFLEPLEAAEGGAQPVTNTAKSGAKAKEDATKEVVPKSAVIKKDTDWNKPPSPTAPTGDVNEMAYQAGEKAGLMGQDCAAGIKAKGWHHASAPAKKFREGHAKGMEQRKPAQAAIPPTVSVAPASTVTPGANNGGYQYQDGKRAAEAGMPVNACPYPAGSMSASNWNSGWMSVGVKATASPSDVVGYTMETGRVAAREGQARDTNPHGPGTQAFETWDAGWELGEAERQEAQAIVNGALSGNPVDEAGNATTIDDEAKQIDAELQAQQDALAAG